MDSLEAARGKWNDEACGENAAEHLEAGSKEYFEAIRNSRYEITDSWMNEAIPWETGKGQNLLEIGCGIGTDLVRWARAGATVTAVEPTDNHRKLAKENLELADLPGKIVDADARELPFDDDQFDIVYSNGVLHHIDPVGPVFAEIRRVLKPGGRLIFSVYRKWSGFYLFQKLAWNGILRGDLFRLGHQGLLSTIEAGADGKKFKPYVKLYSDTGARRQLRQFSDISLSHHHFSWDHVLPIRPRIQTGGVAERALGWYLLCQATKPIND